MWVSILCRERRLKGVHFAERGDRVGRVFILWRELGVVADNVRLPTRGVM